MKRLHVGLNVSRKHGPRKDVMTPDVKRAFEPDGDII
jgi:hypothetical protein